MVQLSTQFSLSSLSAPVTPAGPVAPETDATDFALLLADAADQAAAPASGLLPALRPPPADDGNSLPVAVTPSTPPSLSKIPVQVPIPVARLVPPVVQLTDPTIGEPEPPAPPPELPPTALNATPSVPTRAIERRAPPTNGMARLFIAQPPEGSETETAAPPSGNGADRDDSVPIAVDELADPAPAPAAPSILPVAQAPLPNPAPRHPSPSPDGEPQLPIDALPPSPRPGLTRPSPTRGNRDTDSEAHPWSPTLPIIGARSTPTSAIEPRLPAFDPPASDDRIPVAKGAPLTVPVSRAFIKPFVTPLNDDPAAIVAPAPATAPAAPPASATTSVPVQPAIAYVSPSPVVGSTITPVSLPPVGPAAIVAPGAPVTPPPRPIALKSPEATGSLSISPSGTQSATGPTNGAAPAPGALSVAQPAPVLIGVAQPALRAFATAIAAIARPVARRTPTEDAPAPVAPGTGLLAPTDTSARIDPVAAPVDTRRADWPVRIIDHIEALRDAADARDTRITLVPHALGKIDVAVRQDGDTLHVHFAAEAPATRVLIAEAQPRLAEIAEQRGLRLGQSSVDSGSGQQQRQSQPQPAAVQPTPAQRIDQALFTGSEPAGSIDRIA